MSSDLTLVGFGTLDGLLRWAAVLFLVVVAIIFFARRKKLDSNRPWVAMVVAALVIAPILLLETVMNNPETPVARRTDDLTPVNPEPEKDSEPEPEPEPEPVVPDDPNFNPVTPDTDDNRSTSYIPSKDIVKPAGESGRGSVEIYVDYKVVYKQLDLDGESYTTVKTEDFTVKEGDVVTPTVYDYEGFDSPDPISTQITADTIKTIEYRYVRKQFDLSVYNGKYVNGGKSGRYYYGTEFELEAWERPGYDFAGWSDMSHEKTVKFTLTADKVIGPNYLPKHYEVEFHANNENATGEMENQELVYDKEEALNENQFVVKGYFIRWNTQADGKGDYYDDKQVVKNLSTGDKVDLYAIWLPRTDTPYKVIHKKMTPNGDYVNAEEEIEDLTGTTGKQVTPATKEYAGFVAPALHTETISGNGDTAIVYEYARDKYMLRLGELSHIDAADRDKSGEYYFGATIELTAEASFDGAVFDKWSDGETSNVRSFVMPPNDTILYPLYKGDGDFPVVFEQIGQCSFNGKLTTLTTEMKSADYMTGDDCLRHTEDKYIDTGVELFSNDNIGKDFLISFTIDEFDLSKNGYRPTLVNSTLESNDYLFAGLVLRRDNATTNFLFGNNVVYYKSNGSLARDAKKLYEGAVAKKVMIYRKGGKIYYKTTDNNGNWKAQTLLGNQNLSSDKTLFTHDTPLYFGASREKVNDVWKATKFMDAKMSDIVVRLGSDTTGLIPTN